MSEDLTNLTVDLVKAHLVQNRMSHRDVPAFINDVYSTLAQLGGASVTRAPVASTADVLADDSAAQAPIAAEPTPTEPEAEPEAAAEAEVAGPQKVAPVLHDDISDPAFKGLDPWLAVRINRKMATKLNAKNKPHPTVYRDKLICLEDGAEVKLLRPYVEKRFGLTFAEYMDKWHLPDDYPTAPPAYLEAKRAAAKASGLGVTTRAKREKRGATKTVTAKTAKATKTPKAATAPTATTGRGARGKKRAAPLV